MRRHAAALAALVALLAPAGAGAADPPPPPPPPVEGTPPPATPAPTPTQPSVGQPGSGGSGASSWARREIAAVVAAGLLAPSIAEFRPDAALTRGELAELFAALGARYAPGAKPEQPVRLRELDAQLVRLLGLAPAAKHVRSTLVRAGLSPRPYAGTEVVARLLGLRLNHPQTDERLELLPNNPVTRAETAYSVARVLDLRGAATLAAIDGQARSFTLPELTDWQRQVLARATRFVGWPYIWGGSSERAQSPFGKRTPGGFDCSGFVWRVYKLEPFAGAEALAGTLRGRTTYVMSGEVPPGLRIALGALLPADVVFFGQRGPKSKPAQVGHMGIYLGNGWMVHSSSRGTTIAPLDGWYATSFAWGRRPLAEAGL